MTTLRTFRVPFSVTGTESDIALGRRLIEAWQADGILLIATDAGQDRATAGAMAASKRFFGKPLADKAAHVSDLTYSGYIASGEEVTAGEADYSEIFTVCKDVPLADARTKAGWPCHGPVPWPDPEYRLSMSTFMEELGRLGEKLLALTALGLGFPADTLTRLTADGWHHMRVLRFPAASASTSRGIGAHTDYGLLVIAAQDEVGGLYVRPPVEGEHRNRNWLDGESTAGMYEDDDNWTFVPPEPSVLTVFPRRRPPVPHRRRGALHPAQGPAGHPRALHHGLLPRAQLRGQRAPAVRRAGRRLDPLRNPFHQHVHALLPGRVTTRRILEEDRLAVLAKQRELNRTMSPCML